MIQPSILNKENLYEFIEEHGNNRIKRELISFWGRHPNTKFNIHAVCFALDCGKLEAERALKDMVNTGLVNNHTSDGLALYSLTRNEEKRNIILELSDLSYDQWNIIAKRIEQRVRVATVTM